MMWVLLLLIFYLVLGKGTYQFFKELCKAEGNIIYNKKITATVFILLWPAILFWVGIS